MQVRTATVLFTDLHGFGRLVEMFSDDPARLLDVLNAHLAAVVRAILQREGVIEKFLGDSVMATFGTASTSSPAARSRCW